MNKNIDLIPKIRVLIRKRPLSDKQYGKGQKDIVDIPGQQTVIVKQQKVKVDLTPYTDQYKFIFDGAFGDQATNQEIYYSAVRPLINAAFDGARVSCFAYGQTGSGKTHTMLGNGSNVRGLYLLAAQDVFGIVNNFQNISVCVSFYEIYCGKLYDLLNDRHLLYAREDAKNNINIVGLSETPIWSIDDIMKIIDFGMSIRVTSQNSTNADSSRSHAILQITLKKKDKVHGKISFVDLAGSQRAADHADQTDKQTRIDGAEINKSLLALKQCIRALDQNKNHTPFRGSKLTMVLKDSFTGYCKTVMIGNISPNSSSCENTLNTLKYADRVKELKKTNHNNQKNDGPLNDLSKQLMLPRQMVSHKEVVNKKVQNHSQIIAPKFGNFFSNPSQKMQIQENSYQQKPHNLRKKSDQLRHNPNKHYESNGSLNHRRATLGTPSLGIGNNLKPNQLSNNMNMNVRKKSAGNQSHLSNYKKHSPQSIKKSHQQTKEEIYERLGERHQEMLHKVLQGEESILQEHQKFLQFSYENIKKHASMMSNAEQIGSSIQNYLDNLDGSLDEEIDQIYRLKAHLQNLKYNLDESKKIEQLYKNVNQRFNFNQNVNYPNNPYQKTPERNESLDIGSSGNDEELLFDL